MVTTCKEEGCDREVYIKKTGECQRCYMRRYNRAYYQAHPEKFAKPGQQTYLCIPAWSGIGPCGYKTAHQRVYRLRGKASGHTCPCGQPAEEWSYRGGSPWEQTGTKPSKTGRTRVQVSWSSHPGWYDALCRQCHNIRDGRPPGTSSSARTRQRRRELAA